VGPLRKISHMKLWTLVMTWPQVGRQDHDWRGSRLKASEPTQTRTWGRRGSGLTGRLVYSAAARSTPVRTGAPHASNNIPVYLHATYRLGGVTTALQLSALGAQVVIMLNPAATVSLRANLLIWVPIIKAEKMESSTQSKILAVLKGPRIRTRDKVQNCTK